MLERLTRRRAEAERACEEAVAAVPAAILNGDEAGLAELRRQRHDSAVEADDLAEAIDLAAERERRAKESAAAEARRRALTGVRSAHSELLEAAAGVDEALAALENAVARYGDAQSDLNRRRADAGLGHDSGFALKGRQNMRWATWGSAPTFAQLAEIPFANAARRRALRMLVPDLPTVAGEEGR